jgi:hypothetical protein
MLEIVLLFFEHCQLAKQTLLMAGNHPILDIPCPNGLGIGHHDYLNNVLLGSDKLGRIWSKARCLVQNKFGIKQWQYVSEMVQVIGDRIGQSLLGTVVLTDRHKIRFTAAITLADAISKMKAIYFGTEVRYVVFCVGNDELARSEMTDNNKEVILKRMLNDISVIG